MTDLTIDARELSPILSNDRPGMTQCLMTACCTERLRDLALLSELASQCSALVRFQKSLQALFKSISAVGAAADERLRSPIFIGWLTRFGTIRQWERPEPALLQLLNQIPNMQHRIASSEVWSDTFAVCNGRVSTFDGHTLLAGVAGESIDLAMEGGYLRTTGSSAPIDPSHACPERDAQRTGVEAAPWIVSVQPLPATAIHVRNDIPLLQVRLNLSRITERTHAVDHDRYDHSPSTYGEFDQQVFQEAAATVREAWPAEYLDWCLTMRVVVPIASPPGHTINGFTNQGRPGACWIGARGLVPVIDALIHEQSHVKLRYIDEVAPLLKPGETSFHQVGWRDDPRPIEGIVEGVYVNLHVIEGLGRILDGHAIQGPLRSQASNRLRQLHRQVTEGAAVLDQHARFTLHGEAFGAWAQTSLVDLRQRYISA